MGWELSLESGWDINSANKFQIISKQAVDLHGVFYIINYYMSLSLEIHHEGIVSGANIMATELLGEDDKVELILIPVRSMTPGVGEDQDGNRIKSSVITPGDTKDPKEVTAHKVQSKGFNDWVVPGYARFRGGELQLIRVARGEEPRNGRIRGKEVELGEEIVGQYKEGGAFPGGVLVFLEGYIPKRALPAIFRSDAPKTRLTTGSLSTQVKYLSHDRRWSKRP